MVVSFGGHGGWGTEIQKIFFLGQSAGEMSKLGVGGGGGGGGGGGIMGGG